MTASCHPLPKYTTEAGGPVLMKMFLMATLCITDSNSATCPAGLAPPDCQQSCQKGHFGINCASQCPGTCANRLCQPASGHCYRCRSGFTGSKCQRTCRQGFHGQDCGKACPVNCLKNRCDPFSGLCEGCLPGFRGTRCEFINSSTNLVVPAAVNKSTEDGDGYVNRDKSVLLYVVIVGASFSLPVCSFMIWCYIVKRKARQLGGYKLRSEGSLKTPIYRRQFATEGQTLGSQKPILRWPRGKSSHYQEMKTENDSPKKLINKRKLFFNILPTESGRTKRNKVDFYDVQTNSSSEVSPNLSDVKGTILHTGAAPAHNDLVSDLDSAELGKLLKQNTPLRLSDAANYSRELFFKMPLPDCRAKLEYSETNFYPEEVVEDVIAPSLLHVSFAPECKKGATRFEEKDYPVNVSASRISSQINDRNAGSENRTWVTSEGCPSAVMYDAEDGIFAICGVGADTETVSRAKRYWEKLIKSTALRPAQHCEVLGGEARQQDHLKDLNVDASFGDVGEDNLTSQWIGTTVSASSVVIDEQCSDVYGQTTEPIMQTRWNNSRRHSRSERSKETFSFKRIFTGSPAAYILDSQGSKTENYTEDGMDLHQIVPDGQIQVMSLAPPEVEVLHENTNAFAKCAKGSASMSVSTDFASCAAMDVKESLGPEDMDDCMNEEYKELNTGDSSSLSSEPVLAADPLQCLCQLGNILTQNIDIGTSSHGWFNQKSLLYSGMYVENRAKYTEQTQYVLEAKLLNSQSSDDSTELMRSAQSTDTERDQDIVILSGRNVDQTANKIELYDPDILPTAEMPFDINEDNIWGSMNDLVFSPTGAYLFTEFDFILPFQPSLSKEHYGPRYDEQFWQGYASNYSRNLPFHNLYTSCYVSDLNPVPLFSIRDSAAGWSPTHRVASAGLLPLLSLSVPRTESMESTMVYRDQSSSEICHEGRFRNKKIRFASSGSWGQSCRGNMLTPSPLSSPGKQHEELAETSNISPRERTSSNESLFSPRKTSDVKMSSCCNVKMLASPKKTPTRNAARPKSAKSSPESKRPRKKRSPNLMKRKIQCTCHKDSDEQARWSKQSTHLDHAQSKRGKSSSQELCDKNSPSKSERCLSYPASSADAITLSVSPCQAYPQEGKLCPIEVKTSYDPLAAPDMLPTVPQRDISLTVDDKPFKSDTSLIKPSAPRRQIKANLRNQASKPEQPLEQKPVKPKPYPRKSSKESSPSQQRSPTQLNYYAHPSPDADNSQVLHESESYSLQQSTFRQNISFPIVKQDMLSNEDTNTRQRMSLTPVLSSHSSSARQNVSENYLSPFQTAQWLLEIDGNSIHSSHFRVQVDPKATYNQVPDNVSGFIKEARADARRLSPVCERTKSSVSRGKKKEDQVQGRIQNKTRAAEYNKTPTLKTSEQIRASQHACAVQTDISRAEWRQTEGLGSLKNGPQTPENDKIVIALNREMANKAPAYPKPTDQCANIHRPIPKKRKIFHKDGTLASPPKLALPVSESSTPAKAGIAARRESQDDEIRHGPSATINTTNIIKSQYRDGTRLPDSNKSPVQSPIMMLSLAQISFHKWDDVPRLSAYPVPSLLEKCVSPHQKTPLPPASPNVKDKSEQSSKAMKPDDQKHSKSSLDLAPSRMAGSHGDDNSSYNIDVSPFEIPETPIQESATGHQGGQTLDEAFEFQSVCDDVQSECFYDAVERLDPITGKEHEDKGKIVKKSRKDVPKKIPTSGTQHLNRPLGTNMGINKRRHGSVRLVFSAAVRDKKQHSPDCKKQRSSANRNSESRIAFRFAPHPDVKRAQRPRHTQADNSDDQHRDSSKILSAKDKRTRGDPQLTRRNHSCKLSKIGESAESSHVSGHQSAMRPGRCQVTYMDKAQKVEKIMARDKKERLGQSSAMANGSPSDAVETYSGLSASEDVFHSIQESRENFTLPSTDPSR